MEGLSEGELKKGLVGPESGPEEIHPRCSAKHVGGPVPLILFIITCVLSVGAVALFLTALTAERWYEAENDKLTPPIVSYLSLLQHCTYYKSDVNNSQPVCSDSSDLCDLSPDSDLCSLMRGGLTAFSVLMICILLTVIGIALAVVEALLCVKRKRGLRVVTVVLLLLAGVFTLISVIVWGIRAHNYDKESVLFRWHFAPGFHIAVTASCMNIVVLVLYWVFHHFSKRGDNP